MSSRAPDAFAAFYEAAWRALEGDLHGAATVQPSAATTAPAPAGAHVLAQASAADPARALLRAAIKDNPTLPARFACVPRPPILDGPDARELDAAAKLLRLQKYLLALSYNHLGSIFQVRKCVSFKSLMKIGQDICRFGLPIKCLEAVVVATYLTNSFWGLDRYAMSFKSQCSGKIFRHIVLIVKHNNKFGAVGLSRRADLMFKPLDYDSMEQMANEFRRAYVKNMHTVLKVKIGQLIPHDFEHNDKFPWPVG
ncbi:Tubulinyl-Tyr carboxypeptidase 1 [Entophlyctis luteolus]|nr:Tubulinyl-Tyr carboxypeptidase 1 [Entophlyctis luteolus]